MQKPSSPPPKADLILRDAAEVLTCVAAGADPVGRRSGASVAVAGERILAVGSPKEIARQVCEGQGPLTDERIKVPLWWSPEATFGPEPGVVDRLKAHTRTE
jgi:hypothetical protein